MVLSAALDGGYVFMAILAILTSVVGAAYYLNLIKDIFFYKSDYVINPTLSERKEENSSLLVGYVSSFQLEGIEDRKTIESAKKIHFKWENITLNSALSATIAILTLLLISFIYMPAQWFNIVNILTLILFKA